MDLDFVCKCLSLRIYTVAWTCSCMGSLCWLWFDHKSAYELLALDQPKHMTLFLLAASQVSCNLFLDPPLHFLFQNKWFTWKLQSEKTELFRLPRAIIYGIVNRNRACSCNIDFKCCLPNMWRIDPAFYLLPPSTHVDHYNSNRQRGILDFF